MTRFGNHPAFHRPPLYFVYDSYLTRPAEWASVLARGGEHTVRGTALDGQYIGLWVEATHGTDLVQGRFDGAYTYFAVDGMTYGSTSLYWREMGKFCAAHGLSFFPCAGPGYNDEAVRPWNVANTRPRRGGGYYRAMFAGLQGAKISGVGITSFNEAHEGTNIEASVPHEAESGALNPLGRPVKYEVWDSPEMYLDITAELVEGLHKTHKKEN